MDANGVCKKFVSAVPFVGLFGCATEAGVARAMRARGILTFTSPSDRAPRGRVLTHPALEPLTRGGPSCILEGWLLQHGGVGSRRFQPGGWRGSMPWVPQRIHAQFRRRCQAAAVAAGALRERARKRRPCFVLHPASSWIWHQTPLAEVLELEGVISTWTCTCRYGAQFGTPMRIAHNSPALDVLFGSGQCGCPLEGKARLGELPVQFAEVFGRWAKQAA